MSSSAAEQKEGAEPVGPLPAMPALQLRFFESRKMNRLLSLDAARNEVYMVGRKNMESGCSVFVFDTRSVETQPQPAPLRVINKMPFEVDGIALDRQQQLLFLAGSDGKGDHTAVHELFVLSGATGAVISQMRLQHRDYRLDVCTKSKRIFAASESRVEVLSYDLKPLGTLGASVHDQPSNKQQYPEQGIFKGNACITVDEVEDRVYIADHTLKRVSVWSSQGNFAHIRTFGRATTPHVEAQSAEREPPVSEGMFRGLHDVKLWRPAVGAAPLLLIGEFKRHYLTVHTTDGRRVGWIKTSAKAQEGVRCLETDPTVADSQVWDCGLDKSPEPAGCCSIQ